ncbi:MAG TPA: hypothetical protein VGK99_04655 [Acidobacteriota bacterium]
MDDSDTADFGYPDFLLLIRAPREPGYRAARPHGASPGGSTNVSTAGVSPRGVTLDGSTNVSTAGVSRRRYSDASN